MSEHISLSRPSATAALLGALAEDRHRFTDKRVLITGEDHILSTRNGNICFLASIRLVSRYCKSVTVSVPAGMSALRSKSQRLLEEISFGDAAHEVREEVQYSEFDAILSIGSRANAQLPWTVINSNGWSARVSSKGSNLSSECAQENAIGALAAASLGASEVFKRLIKLKAIRGDLFDALAFNLFDYTCVDAAGPSISPFVIPNDTLLLGAGAIGNGIVFLLENLPAQGEMAIVDRQAYGDENLGTCILIGPASLTKGKAEFLAMRLQNTIKVRPYRENVEKFEKRLGGVEPFPRVILGALDNIDARHSVQDLWPDLILDGAIGDFGVQASVHPLIGDTACLRCLFQKREVSDSVKTAMQGTGLTAARIAQNDELVSESDVANAPPEKREWLRQQVGKPICSVVAEGVAQQLTDTQLGPGFEPSVPFVACLSACMVVGELVKSLLSFPTNMDPRYQMDVLRGPIAGELFPQARRQSCVCVARRKNILRLRELRGWDSVRSLE